MGFVTSYGHVYHSSLLLHQDRVQRFLRHVFFSFRVQSCAVRYPIRTVRHPLRNQRSFVWCRGYQRDPLESTAAPRSRPALGHVAVLNCRLDSGCSSKLSPKPFFSWVLLLLMAVCILLVFLCINIGCSVSYIDGSPPFGHNLVQYAIQSARILLVFLCINIGCSVSYIDTSSPFGHNLVQYAIQSAQYAIHSATNALSDRWNQLPCLAVVLSLAMTLCSIVVLTPGVLNRTRAYCNLLNLYNG
ncbi:hypothetical protein B0H10DRAFT_2075937, partial [Mycena sp. CBHHK59/15]